MARVWCALALVALCPLALTRHDDDFAFDNSDEFQVELTANHSEISKNGLRRLWGVPDTTAYVGHLFRMEIPKEAFTGDVQAYKVRSADGRRTPSWLAVDSKHGLISGVPQSQDVGSHAFTVTAHGRTAGLTASDSFTVEVKRSENKPQSKYGTCGSSQRRLVLTILIDQTFDRIAPRQRIRALLELASFMALDADEFSMAASKAEPSPEQAVLASGPGNTQRRRGEATTAIYLNVGCGDKLWSRHKVLVAGLREQSRDGTLAHLLRLPVLGWRLLAVTPAPRLKRQLPLQDEGSGGNYDEDNEDDDAADYSGYGNYDEEDDDYNGEFGPSPNPVPPPAQTPAHPHRHHHGDATAPTSPDTFQTDAAATVPPTEPTDPTSPAPLTTVAPQTTTPLPTTEMSTAATAAPPTVVTATNAFVGEDEGKIKIEPYPENQPTNQINFTRLPDITGRGRETPVMIVPEETLPDYTTPEIETQTVIIRASNEIPTSPSPATEPTFAVTSPAPAPPPTTELTTPTPTPTPAPPPTTESTTTSSSTRATPVTLPPTTPTTPTPTLPPLTTPEPETTLPEVTFQETYPTATDTSSTIFGRTTETININQPPILKHHMKKLAITAGKAFRYIIPSGLFTDMEDEGNLNFTMYEADNVPLSQNSWIQFIPAGREVYGLPLEAHVSRWNYIVEARDSENATARGPLDITVQQHKSGRTVNHQFVFEFKTNKPYEHAIDWQIRALEGLVNLFRDTDMDHLTVLSATQDGDICTFIWTNDTLPKDPCPMDDINRLMKIMESPSEKGSPSAELVRAMSPDLKMSKVSWRGVGKCEEKTGPATPAATRSPDTYPPVTRNHVDLLTATVGNLLVYTVPEDTFFDPEDGGTRNLHLSLRYNDRSELPPGHWLQFDSNNQEFYGLPSEADIGITQYLLAAQDSSKKNAYDSLIVEVVKAPAIRPTVEFQMTMEYPFANLAQSALNKRRVVEKIGVLFGQSDPSSIRILSITENPTTIIWYNTSLPMDRCPEREIDELRKMIMDERTLKANVDQVFDKDFKVMSIRLIPLGLCAEQNTKTPKVHAPIHGNNNNMQNKAGPASDGGYTEYLVTFIIPAVVIVCMILVAGIIACVLYRRRRTGKMSVGDEEERQAFRSKGIPVIFQDELEEQAGAEPLHKSPVIMREEKPPLLPPAPDYRNSAPYRPPPPVNAATTPPRPKATPTYRKPPPYVPP